MPHFIAVTICCDFFDHVSFIFLGEALKISVFPGLILCSRLRQAETCSAGVRNFSSPSERGSKAGKHYSSRHYSLSQQFILMEQIWEKIFPRCAIKEMKNVRGCLRYSNLNIRDICAQRS